MAGLDRRLRLTTYNIASARAPYALAACLGRGVADIVCLQEVTIANRSCVEEFAEEHNYRVCSAASALSDGYYCVTLVHARRMKLRCTNCAPFPAPYAGEMSRSTLTVECTHLASGASVAVINTHLESLKECAAVRKQQLTHCWRLLAQSDADLAIVAGDMNARDPEVLAVGGLPAGIVDAWQAAGSSSDHRYTWDTAVNKNLGAPFVARCRFDRVYYRFRTRVLEVLDIDGDPAGSSTIVDTETSVEQKSFELIGKDAMRISDKRMHPSDHFGIVVSFLFSGY
jgi:endonuclease/exonuclease/phosphatase family metal-dependent hydrolase